MPAVKIELKKGLDKNSLYKIRDSILDSVVAALKLPSNDRNIRIMEFEDGFFQMKAPYEMLVEITMFSGRTKETKKKLIETIVNNLDSNTLMSREKILIIINEQPMENWGVRGGIPANEIDLGFKVNI
jgi:4-oxalocrotonate tautomerase family enzyme